MQGTSVQPCAYMFGSPTPLYNIGIDSSPSLTVFSNTSSYVKLWMNEYCYSTEVHCLLRSSAVRTKQQFSYPADLPTTLSPPESMGTIAGHNRDT